MEFENAAVRGGSVSAQQPYSRHDAGPSAEISATAPGEFKVIRRNGKVTTFDGNKIKVALTKAFLAVEGSSAAASTRIHQRVDDLTDQIVAAVTRRMPLGGATHIEDIQDHVELALMRAAEHKIARSYVLYRDERARERQAAQKREPAMVRDSAISVALPDGSRVPLDENRLKRVVDEACANVEGAVPAAIVEETLRSLFDGVAEADVSKSLAMSARMFIEREPNYTYVAARL